MHRWLAIAAILVGMLVAPAPRAQPAPGAGARSYRLEYAPSVLFVPARSALDENGFERLRIEAEGRLLWGLGADRKVWLGPTLHGGFQYWYGSDHPFSFGIGGLGRFEHPRGWSVEGLLGYWRADQGRDIAAVGVGVGRRDLTLRAKLHRSSRSVGETTDAGLVIRSQSINEVFLGVSGSNPRFSWFVLALEVAATVFFLATDDGRCAVFGWGTCNS